MNRIEAILNWVEGPRVLDVGCAGQTIEDGSPYWLHGRLRELPIEVVGIDGSAEKVSELHSRGFEGVELQDAEEMKLPGTYNTIVAGELIEHLPNPGKFLARCKDHMPMNGRLIITTPYPFSLPHSLYALVKFPDTVQNDEHTCWFCPKTLRGLASRFGLRVEYFSLVEDYRPDVGSLRYRIFVRLISLFGWALPTRLRLNAMLVVMVRDENPDSP